MMFILDAIKEKFYKKLLQAGAIAFVSAMATGLADKIVIPYIKKKIEPKKTRAKK